MPKSAGEHLKGYLQEEKVAFFRRHGYGEKPS